MGVLDKLTHKIDITDVGSTNFAGETSPSTTTLAVDCYIMPKTRRFISDSQEEIQTDVMVIFKGTAVVEVGWLLQNGLDVKGVTMATTAVIQMVDKISDPKKGMRVIEVFAKTI